MTADSARNPLEELKLFDPETADLVVAGLEALNYQVPPGVLTMLVDETIHGLSLEISFGRAIAKGFLQLSNTADRVYLEQYRELVRSAGNTGPTVGRILAVHLVAVLKSADSQLLRYFIRAFDTMQRKGTYTLQRPLGSLQKLLEADQRQSAVVYLTLLNTTFSLPLTYNQSQHFAHLLPKAMEAFSPVKRVWQLQQLLRIMQTDFNLVDPFIEGLNKGLSLLSQTALQRFVSRGLNKSLQNLKSGSKFLALDSQDGLDIFADLQVTVSISQVQPQLNRYLQARTGFEMTVRPLSALPRFVFTDDDQSLAVCSDNHFIYLPDEIDVFSRRDENVKLYKCLARFESGHHEFGTFDFDFEKVLECCDAAGCRLQNESELNGCFHSGRNAEDSSGLEQFIKLFQVPALAHDLFTAFEHGRIRSLFSRFYPGLVRTYLPVLQKEMLRIDGDRDGVSPLLLLYAEIALGTSLKEKYRIDDQTRGWLIAIGKLFEEKISHPQSPVEKCGQLVALTYAETEELLQRLGRQPKQRDHYTPLKIPFNRRLRFDLYYETNLARERMARAVQKVLAKRGYKVYRSEIKKYLKTTPRVLQAEQLQEILRDSTKNNDVECYDYDTVADELSRLDLLNHDGSITSASQESVTGQHPVFRYKEWDCHLGDYLNDHVRVVERRPAGCDSNFYDHILRQYQGLVLQIRRSFELLKPEGLKLYRKWIEGDEFDYRALLDYAVERKAGRTPSERLYIKRMKELRDVAVLLLVDLSRSTSTAVAGSSSKVIDVEKEAIVLFSQALEVVGDTYAVAGFSGTGRLGVDYFRIKDFEQPMSHAVHQRIAAMTPRRNTRMGAAIRHAASQFADVQPKIRLLIILSDGFPNDLEYKREYAVEDTRKAISELRSTNIYVHAITINISLVEESKLDDLYGDIHHNVITEITELPDKLWRIYRALTH